MNLSSYLNALNHEFAQTEYGQDPVELYEPIRYLMSLGGKRLRPLLTLMATSMLTDDWQKALKPAMAVEVFHNFTLMHDDIMDQAPLRRGKPTVHAKWDENVAILSGDVMLVCAYELMLDAPAGSLKRILKRFNRTAAEVCEGQQWDMNFEKRERVSEQEYLRMIELKTAVLLGFALELGGIIGEANDDVCTILYSIGVNIGLGFQLKDDILDVYGDADKFGKQVGGDIIANKKTLLLIEAQERAEERLKEELLLWLNAKEFDATQKVAAVTAIYDQLGIKQAAEKLMNSYFAKAFESLESLPIESKRKQVLVDFATWLIDRES